MLGSISLASQFSKSREETANYYFTLYSLKVIWRTIFILQRDTAILRREATKNLPPAFKISGQSGDSLLQLLNIHLLVLSGD
jgi:hypothetical protein